MDFKNAKPSGNFEDRTGEGSYSIGKLLSSIQAAMGWYAGGKKIEAGQGFGGISNEPTPKGEFPTMTARELQEEIRSQDPEYRKQKAAKVAKDKEFYRKLEEEIGVRPRR